MIGRVATPERGWSVNVFTAVVLVLLIALAVFILATIFRPEDPEEESRKRESVRQRSARERSSAPEGVLVRTRETERKLPERPLTDVMPRRPREAAPVAEPARPILTREAPVFRVPEPPPPAPPPPPEPPKVELPAAVAPPSPARREEKAPEIAPAVVSPRGGGPLLGQVAALLRQKHGLAAVFVLREILDPPLSQRGKRDPSPQPPPRNKEGE